LSFFSTEHNKTAAFGEMFRKSARSVDILGWNAPDTTKEVMPIAIPKKGTYIIELKFSSFCFICFFFRRILRIFVNENNSLRD
jgi:hypothetical protein